MKSLSIRTRMTLWYGALMTLLLGAFGAAVVWLTVQRFTARIDFELAEEMNEVLVQFANAANRQDLQHELQEEFAQHPDYEFEIIDAQASFFFQSKRLAASGWLFDAPQGVTEVRVADWLARHSDSPEEFANVALRMLGKYRVLRRRAETPYGQLILQAAIPMQPLLEIEADLLRVILVLGPCVLVCAIGGGSWMAKRMLAPISEITSTASEITATHLKRRIDVVDTDDELSRLGRTLNDMIDRLDRAFDDMQRFTADAAHELRTPLTVMRTQLDVALRTDRTADAYRDVLISLRDDVERMTKLATQLLELAREDAGLVHQTLGPVALHELVQVGVQQLLPEATRKNVAIDLEEVEPIEVRGDAERLQRVVVNLLDNAVKFSPSGGSIACRLMQTSDGASVRLDITDRGPGIAVEHLPFIFDRFYRTEASRSSPGTGLGLSICKAIVTAHGGEIRLISPALGLTAEVHRDGDGLHPSSAGEALSSRGTTVTVELPLRR